jgi:hypothetical protein
MSRGAAGSGSGRVAGRARLFLALIVLPASPGLWPAAAAAGESVRLRSPRIDAASSLSAGPLLVTWRNARPQEKGGEDEFLIGLVRGGLGQAYKVKSEGPEHLFSVIPDLVAASLRAAGIDGRTEGTDALPVVHVNLLEFWCDGYDHYEMTARLEVLLRAPGALEPAWRGEAYGRGSATMAAGWGGGMREFERGYTEALQNLAGELKKSFESNEFRLALGTASAPRAQAPVPPPPAAPPSNPAPGDAATAPLAPTPALPQASSTAAAATTPAPAVSAPPSEIPLSDLAAWVDRSVRVEKRNGTYVAGTLVGTGDPLVVMKADGRLLELARSEVLAVRPGG